MTRNGLLVTLSTMDVSWKTSATLVRTDRPKYSTPWSGASTGLPRGPGGCGSKRACGSGPARRNVSHCCGCRPATVNMRTSLVAGWIATMSSSGRMIAARAAGSGGWGSRANAGSPVCRIWPGQGRTVVMARSGGDGGQAGRLWPSQSGAMVRRNGCGPVKLGRSSGQGVGWQGGYRWSGGGA
jgi:hypothetical protein